MEVVLTHPLLGDEVVDQHLRVGDLFNLCAGPHGPMLRSDDFARRRLLARSAYLQQNRHLGRVAVSIVCCSPGASVMALRIRRSSSSNGSGFTSGNRTGVAVSIVLDICNLPQCCTNAYVSVPTISRNALNGGAQFADVACQETKRSARSRLSIKKRTSRSPLASPRRFPPVRSGEIA